MANEMKILKTALAGMIGKAVSKEDKAALAAFVTNMAADPLTPGLPIEDDKPEDGIKTKDGKVLTIEGEMIKGSPIMEITSTGPAPATDGNYELVDGTMLVVSGGKISEVKAVEAIPNASPADMEKAIATQMASHKAAIEKDYAAKFAAQEVKYKKLEETTALTAKMLQSILDAPLETIEFAKADPVNFDKALNDEEYSKLTNHQKLQYNKIHKR